MLRHALIALVLSATAALAECPAVAPVDPAYFETLAGAPDESAGQAAEGDIWRQWLMAPDAEAQGSLDAGIQRIGWADYAGAEAALDPLVARCPAYAEGWNQRAFARFLQGDYDGALADLDRALAIEPRHFAALAGKALSLFRQGRAELAQHALTAAVALHPWLKERHLLAPGVRT